ncbi:MAG TPA: polyprenyl synthetase family protein, partial [Thermoflexia bacterium]|nr:polyprenyl synthetase family protein [Thermoflexia bacterium]
MDPFTRYLPALEREMRAITTPQADSPALLYGMLHYHLGWVDRDFQPVQRNAGKRLRPVFLLLATEAQGGPWQPALPVAAAVELLHNFSLIHDDIEDQDHLRHGYPTLWDLWGEAQAINAGDALFNLAYQALLRLRARGVAPERILELQEGYLDTVTQLTEGQCRDIGFESAATIAEETYLQMVGGKTAALLSLCCAAGGLLAEAPSAQVTALREFGYNLGMSFQMQDDLLGLWGDSARTGKPVGSDLRQHKKTLPLLHGMAESVELRALLTLPALTEAEITRAQQLLETTGSRAYTQARVRNY